MIASSKQMTWEQLRPTLNDGLGAGARTHPVKMEGNVLVRDSVALPQGFKLKLEKAGKLLG